MSEITPLSPEEVGALERGERHWGVRVLIATVRDRERLFDDLDRKIVKPLVAERDELQRRYDLVQQNFTKLGGQLAETTQQRDKLQRQLAEARKSLAKYLREKAEATEAEAIDATREAERG